MIQVGIIMGSDSDLPIMQEAAKILEQFDISYELTIISAHRTPDRLVEYAKSAEEKGLQVIIAGAGGAVALPGMTASFCPLPVIGVPIMTKTMKGLDSLLSIAQMPPGIPVATVTVNGGKNAGLLAATILGSGDLNIRKKVAAYKNNLESDIIAKAEKLEKIGYEQYLKDHE